VTAADRLYEQVCAIYGRNGGWPIHVRDLLGEWVSPSTIHMHLANLQRRGLVEKGPGPRDGFRPKRRTVA
jgi:DNA-binding MarR family transcriptional regulator